MVEVPKVLSISPPRAVGLRMVGVVTRMRSELVDGGETLSGFGEQRDHLHSDRRRWYATDGYILERFQDAALGLG